MKSEFAVKYDPYYPQLQGRTPVLLDVEFELLSGLVVEA